jgi:NAD(P)-dependent dehydrogenase (short-subunit alcohol dehydrogenase family)
MFSLESFYLKEKVAIVTGAGGRVGGIGRAYALGLALAGATVVAADVNEHGARAVAEEINAAGDNAIGVQVDIGDQASVRAVVARVTTDLGGVDILVNNAALMLELTKADILNVDLETWNRAIQINLTGALLCAQAAAPSMIARGGGRIVNQISSGAYPALSVFGITKLALAGLTTTLAQMLGRQGITVNAIAPGVTDSGAGLTLRENASAYFKMLEQTVPLRVRGEPGDLVGALLLLCSPAGSWITGQVLHVDGGVVLRP